MDAIKTNKLAGKFGMPIAVNTGASFRTHAVGIDAELGKY